MFELTFGKLIVVICATTTAVGKAGVPPLAKSLGYQFGRVVGLLQGVKVKLEDVVDSNSEIKEMGKELHSELRKLDSVRTEFAIAAGSVGGGGVGNMRMFELTFGKLIVVICATTTAVGKAGVPPLAKSLGYQFGRVVGLLQGVKVKLEDVVDSNSEIKEMGKELHSELRKLDSVRTEFAIAAGSVGGGGVGNMLRNRAVSNLTGQTSISSPSPFPSSPSSSSSPLFPTPNSIPTPRGFDNSRSGVSV